MTMRFSQGERVTHPNKLDLGIGQVLDDSDKTVRVFFVGAGEKTLRLDYVALTKVEGEAAQSAMLDNLKTTKKSRSPKYQSLPLLIETFLRVFPDGFFGAEYFERERNYKFVAHELMLRLLGKDVFHELLSENNHREVCKRALQVVNKTNLLSQFEIMSLRDGIATNEQLFSETLFHLLYSEGDLQKRFESFSDCLLELNAAKWTTATYHLFFAFPDEQMFLKPTVTQAAAEVCGFELNYRTVIKLADLFKTFRVFALLVSGVSRLKAARYDRRAIVYLVCGAYQRRRVLKITAAANNPMDVRAKQLPSNLASRCQGWLTIRY